jgi:serine/threonine-protein kinase
VEVSPPEWFGKHQETVQLEQELWALVQGCLQIDPALRLKADDAVQRCEALCYSATPRKTGVIETYPITYANGGKATAGFISVDGGDSAFFHLTDFFSAGVKPQVGQRVNFGIAAGKPKERCSPVLLLQNA